MVGAWLRLLVNSAVVAAVVVAAQLGAGDALGIIQWEGRRDGGAWTTLVTWVAFSYAVAVLAGALVGRASVRRRRGIDSLGSRVTASFVAAGGSAAVIGLAWLPSQGLEPPNNVNPGLVVSITAGAGVLVGLVLALFALSLPAVATGLQATVAWVWLLAIGAAVAGLTSHETYPAPRLGVPDAPSVVPQSEWTGPRVLVLASVVLALLVAGVTRARGAGRLGASLSGFGGPALVAAAYLIAGPGAGDDRSAQSEPYLAALLATAAGLVASLVVALPGRYGATPSGGRSGRTTRATSGRAKAADRSRPKTADDGAPNGGLLVSTRSPVSAGPPPTTPARPAWAAGSGPYAQAYTSGTHSAGSSSDLYRSAPPSDPYASEPDDPQPVAVTTRGAGWDADTIPGATHGPAGRNSDPEHPTSGLYRSGSLTAEAVVGQPADDPHESWLRGLGGSGRHSAVD